MSLYSPAPATTSRAPGALRAPVVAALEASRAPESSARRPVRIHKRREPGTPVPPDTTTPSGKPLPF